MIWALVSGVVALPICVTLARTQGYGWPDAFLMWAFVCATSLPVVGGFFAVDWIFSP